MSYERIKDKVKAMEYYCLPCYEQLFVQIAEKKESQVVNVCPYCGVSVQQFHASKIVGCSYCYQTLYTEIAPVIVKMQGDYCGHRGKRPPLSEVDKKIFAGMTFFDEEAKEKQRAEMEQRERFSRQKNEMQKLIDYHSGNKERQQEYIDKLDRMERRGVVEEEIVW